MRLAWISTSLVSLAAIGIVGCATGGVSPSVVVLPNSYQIVRAKSAEPVIVKKTGGGVVAGPVATYAVVRDVVIGKIPEPSADAAKARSSSKQQPGYFILKTATGELKAGLSEQDWKDQLKAQGIQTAPSLNAPIL